MLKSSALPLFSATHISLNAYIEGWKSGGGVYSMGHFMKNTRSLLVVPSVLLIPVSIQHPFGRVWICQI